jgi:hypothetical protein
MANPDKMNASLEQMKTRKDVFEEKLDKMDAAMKACLGKTEANLETGREPKEADSKTDLDKMDTTYFEANPEENEAMAKHKEVPKEEAALEIIGALKDRYGDRHLAVGRRRQPKKRTQGDGGSRKKLATACRQMTRLAGRARHKGHGHKGPIF